MFLAVSVKRWHGGATFERVHSTSRSVSSASTLLLPPGGVHESQAELLKIGENLGGENTSDVREPSSRKYTPEKGPGLHRPASLKAVALCVPADESPNFEVHLW